MADSQFTALGLVLLAELAKTRKAVKIDETIANESLHREDTTVRMKGIEIASLEDLGEAVERPAGYGDFFFTEARPTSSVAGVEPGTGILERSGCEENDSHIASATILQRSRSDIYSGVSPLSGAAILEDTKRKSMRKKGRDSFPRRKNSIDAMFDELT